MSRPVLVGAVLYDAAVSTIWDVVREFFDAQGCPIDVVYFTNYELQVRSLLAGHVDVAWNSPLAWLDAQRLSGGTCRAIAMRDTDRDRVSHVVVRADGPVREVADLAGRTVAVGAKDSPQATLIPLAWLSRRGVEPGRDVRVRRFDVLVGKHGDHVGGERDALRCLAEGEADACCMLDLNWDAWNADGTLGRGLFRVLGTTDPFDHCVFTVRGDFDRDAEERWRRALFAMRYDDPRQREVMDLEGLREWVPGRTTGFGPLTDAVRRFGTFEGRGP